MSDALILRPARLDDLPGLEQLEALFPVDRMTRRNLRWMLTRAHGHCTVALLDGDLIGYGLNFYRRGSRQAHLYSIIIKPGHRGRGIADALLASLEADAQAQGCNAMRLEVQTTNAVAIRFYERHGYRREGIKPAYYDNGSDALKMGKAFPDQAQHRAG